MTALFNLTIDTGHARSSSKHEVGREVIEALLPIVRRGKGRIAGWDIQMAHGPAAGSASFTMHHGGLWIVSGHMAWTPQGDVPQWDVVRMLYKPAMMKPMCLPWLAVKLMDAPKANLSVVMEAGDLQRCIGWTVLDVFGEACSASA